MRAVAQVQPPAHVDAGAAQAIEFGHQRRGIDHHARADHRVLAGTQDAARNQLQDKAAAVENDGVAGVVAAGAARDVVEGGRHVVDDLAFAFVAPLRAHHYDGFHPRCRSLSIRHCDPGRTLPEKILIPDHSGRFLKACGGMNIVLGARA